MQIIYAAPFIFIAFLAFLISLAVPKWRTFAIPCLIAPLAFGVCSIVGWIIYALVGNALKSNFSSDPLVLAVAGFLFYLVPGLVGALIAVKIFRIFERKVLARKAAKQIFWRIVFATAFAPLGLILGDLLLLEILPPGNTALLLALDAVCAGLTWIASFAVTAMLQKRTESNDALI